MVASVAVALGVVALLTVVPGPDMAVVARAAVTGGRRAAEQTVAGVVCGLLVWGLLAVAGLAAVLAASDDAYTAVRLLGAAYLIWLGVRAVVHSRDRRNRHVTGGRPDGGAWRTGLAANLLNPKIGVFYTSILPQLVPAGASAAATRAGLVLAHAGLSLVWLNVWARAVGSSRRALDRPALGRRLERLSGFVLVGLGLEITARTW
ncbi:MAG TPA: LysE family translocator [Solirubrobacteraceae bacterium]|jgi:threonine/homoserine/homoserine lactone efflux protein|nr:LysE family translocator [Solirubrobacteraceae bacterium]